MRSSNGRGPVSEGVIYNVEKKCCPLGPTNFKAEEIMAIPTIHGNLILDEAASVQTSGTDNDTGVPGGPDNEVAWSVLLATMSGPLKNELNTLGILPSTGEASGDTSVKFPQAAAR